MPARRLARSLKTLRTQINAAAPNRSKASDGTIGDAAHASRSSDHNPWVRDGGTGVVTALDITHDPARGVDAGILADSLIASRDRRIKYVIWNRRIASATTSPWTWRTYGGANPHTKHVHISVVPDRARYDDVAPWQAALSMLPTGTAAEPVESPPALRKGSKGEAVERLQSLLNANGAALKVDGDFGPRTEDAVEDFQRARGLHADGIVGPYTWDALT